jgi:hypothetical protein
MGDWSVTLGTPEGWLQVPLRETDPQGWAGATAADLLGADAADADAATAFADDLERFVHKTRDLRPLLAAVYVPFPAAGVEAFLVAEVLDRAATPTVAAARAVQEPLHPDLLRPREIGEVDLAIGPALRVHDIFRHAPPDEPPRVLESVSYHVFPPDLPDGVSLVVQWPDLARGEELAGMTDFIASTLEIVAV